MELPLKPDETKPSLSYSAINTYLLCGEAFRLRYIEREHRPRKVVMAFGTAGHEAVVHDLRNKALFDESERIDVLHDVFSTTFDREAQLSLFDAATLQELGGGTVEEAKGRLKDIGIESISLYHEEVAPTVNPKRAEQHFRLELDAAFDIVGSIDVIEDDTEGGEGIGDFKFTASNRHYDPAASLQLTLYGIARAQERDGELPTSAYYRVFRRGKTFVNTEKFAAKPSIDAANKALHVAETIADAITKDVFVPNGLGSWKCSEKYCEYYPCRFVSALKGETK